MPGLRHATALLLGASLTLIAMNVSANDDGAFNSKALDQIKDMAAAMCVHAQTGGSSTKVEASAAIKADLSKLLRKLANLGVDANATYQDEHHEGVLADQVLAATQQSNDCKGHVFDTLIKRLPAPAATGNQITHGNNSPAIGTMTGGTVNIHGN